MKQRNVLDVVLGMDLGDRESVLVALDRQSGEEILLRKKDSVVKTTPDAMRKRFESQPPALIAIETGTHSPWISRLLESLGHEVIVANARELHLISKSHKKCDRRDAFILASFARMNPRLLSPIQHRGLEAQQDLARLRARDNLVQARTQLINAVRGLLKSFGIKLGSFSAPSFHDKARGKLSGIHDEIVDGLLRSLEEISRQIKIYDKSIQELCVQKYPETQVLRQVAGVGGLTALGFALTIENPRRFRKSREVGAYLGLTPKRDQSGAVDKQLGISKAGDPHLRRLLVQAAHYIMGPFGPDTDLRRFGEQLAARGGSAAKKRAIVAVARKLAVLLLAMWKTGEVYEPLRHSKKLAS